MATQPKKIQSILIPQEEVNRLGARPKGSKITQSQTDEAIARTLHAELNPEQDVRAVNNSKALESQLIQESLEQAEMDKAKRLSLEQAETKEALNF